MPEGPVVVVFTAKSVERIVREGGTSSWRLDRNHARRCSFAVCTRNAHADWTEGSESHHTAFLIGKIKDVVPTPGRQRDDRFLIQFSEYAQINVPGVWEGRGRNPVSYAGSLAELEIDPDSLTWMPMPLSDHGEAELPAPPDEDGEARSLTIAEAKQGLARTFGISPEAVEITIRG